MQTITIHIDEDAGHIDPDDTAREVAAAVGLFIPRDSFVVYSENGDVDNEAITHADL